MCIRDRDGERLFNKEMPPEVAKKSVEILRRYGLVPVMELSLIHILIRNNIGIEQNVSITYFIPDAKKAGGSYVMLSLIHI